MSTLKTGLALGGAVIASLLASACCLGPFLLVLLGLGGVGFALALEPYRPWFLGITFILLGLGFYLAYRPGPECGPGEACTLPGAKRWGRIVLWVITISVILLTTFPYYSRLFV